MAETTRPLQGEHMAGVPLMDCTCEVEQGPDDSELAQLQCSQG